MASDSVPTILKASQGEMTYLSKTWYQVWKATGETTDGRLDAWIEVTPPDLGPPEHIHDQYDEIFWSIKGTFLFKADGHISKVSDRRDI